MTLFIKKYQSTNKHSKTFGRTYGRAAMIGTAGIDEISTQIQESCTLTRHDIIAVLSALGPVMSRIMQNSQRVSLPFIGTFKLGVSTIGEEKAEDFDTKTNIKGVHVLFHPETRVNTKGLWEDALTHGTKVAELPKNLKEIVNPDEGGSGSDEDSEEDRP